MPLNPQAVESMVRGGAIIHLGAQLVGALRIKTVRVEGVDLARIGVGKEVVRVQEVGRHRVLVVFHRLGFRLLNN